MKQSKEKSRTLQHIMTHSHEIPESIWGNGNINNVKKPRTVADHQRLHSVNCAKTKIIEISKMSHF